MYRKRFIRWSHELVFYPWRNGVFVSDQRFCAAGRTYSVPDIRRPAKAYGSARAARWVAGQAIAVETALGGAVALTAPPGVAYLVVGGYVVIAAVTLWINIVRWPAPRQLWVAYRGVPTMIYTTTDDLEFGKVCRALKRAIESNQDLAA